MNFYTLIFGDYIKVYLKNERYRRVTCTSCNPSNILLLTRCESVHDQALTFP